MSKTTETIPPSAVPINKPNGKMKSIPTPMLASDWKGKPSVKRVDIKDFMGEGPKFFYYKPLKARELIDLKSVTGLPDLAEKLVNRLHSVIVNEDGSELMSWDDWADVQFPRLREMSELLITSMLSVGDEEEEPESEVTTSEGGVETVPGNV